MTAVLSVNNTPYELDTVPEQVDDIRYCVLDAGNKDEIDFFFHPLIFLESFYAPAICLRIGNHTVQMPMDWSIMICDDDLTEVEVVPLVSLNNRGFKALTMNPLKSKIEPAEIVITNIYQEVKWYFPKLKNGYLLAVPIESGEGPKCAYFVKEINKVCEIDLGDLM